MACGGTAAKHGGHDFGKKLNLLCPRLVIFTLWRVPYKDPVSYFDPTVRNLIFWLALILTLYQFGDYYFGAVHFGAGTLPSVIFVLFFLVPIILVLTM